MILFPVPRKGWYTLRTIRAEVFKRDEFACVHCGWCPLQVPLNWDGLAQLPWQQGPILQYLQLDHIVPAFRGGANNVENFQTLCNRCNASKRIGSTVTRKLAKAAA